MSVKLDKPAAGSTPWDVEINHNWTTLEDESVIVDAAINNKVDGSYGNSASRPSGVTIGYQYFDTDLGYPIYWNGTDWVDCNGEYCIIS